MTKSVELFLISVFSFLTHSPPPLSFHFPFFVSKTSRLLAWVKFVRNLTGLVFESNYNFFWCRSWRYWWSKCFKADHQVWYVIFETFYLFRKILKVHAQCNVIDAAFHEFGGGSYTNSCVNFAGISWESMLHGCKHINMKMTHMTTFEQILKSRFKKIWCRYGRSTGMYSKYDVATMFVGGWVHWCLCLWECTCNLWTFLTSELYLLYMYVNFPF